MDKVALLGLLIGTVYPLMTRAESEPLSVFYPSPYSGPYCSRRPLPNQCCESRDDDCSMPISGTKCYCDQFCNQHGPNRDCCPDYESFCLRIPLRTSCYYNNKNYPVGYIMTDGCKECTCTTVPGGAGRVEMVCRDICSKPIPIQTCFWDNKYIQVGEQIRSGCTECTCTRCRSERVELLCINICDPIPPTTPRPEPYIGCVHKGQYYSEGHRIRDGCNECTCRAYGTHNANMECVNVCPTPVPPNPDIVDFINRGSYGWRAYRYSFLIGKSLDEIYRQRTGVCLPGTTALNPNASGIHSLYKLHEEFDARTQWPGWIQGIHDQMDYPNSWAFSTAEVISDRMAVQTLGEEQHSMSAWNLVSCVNHATYCKSTTKAWQHVHQYGVTTEQCYPQLTGTPGSSCQTSMGMNTYTTRCPNGQREGYLYRMPTQYKVSTREAYIQMEIQSNGPVQAHLRVKPDFFYYHSGVYRHVPASITRSYDASDHYLAVRIIGWGVDRTHGSHTKYWICTNSWGSQWGENGYFRIARGENEADIESYVIGVWPKYAPGTSPVYHSEP